MSTRSARSRPTALRWKWPAASAISPPWSGSFSPCSAWATSLAPTDNAPPWWGPRTQPSHSSQVGPGRRVVVDTGAAAEALRMLEHTLNRSADARIVRPSASTPTGPGGGAGATCAARSPPPSATTRTRQGPAESAARHRNQRAEAGHQGSRGVVPPACDLRRPRRCSREVLGLLRPVSSRVPAPTRGSPGPGGARCPASARSASPARRGSRRGRRRRASRRRR